MSKTHAPLRMTLSVENDIDPVESILQIAFAKISEGFHCIVTIKVDGKAVRMILDTAATKTIFDKKRASNFIADPTRTNMSTPATTAAGETEQQTATIGQLKLDKLILENYEAVLMDLKHINNSYKQHKLKPIDGVLGADILVLNEAVIDLQAKELVFWH
jgi:clan AA aspartic protease (TIGR02281 family)